MKNLMIEPHGRRRRDVVFSAVKDRGFSVSESGEYVVFRKVSLVQDKSKQKEPT